VRGFRATEVKLEGFNYETPEIEMWKVTVGILLGFLILPLGTAQVGNDNVTRTIEVHAKRFAFTPSEITLKKGEKVDIRLISEDVTHALSVPDLNINREINKGRPEDVILTPTSTGDFHGQCGRFCGSGHGTMKFTVHVTE
jgi:cytochrome c oxidase subunit 2